MNTTTRTRRSTKIYIVSIRHTDGTSTSGEFRTLEGAQGRATWAAAQPTTRRVVTNF